MTDAANALPGMELPDDSQRSADGPFVHLHCHTHYSLLDGASRIPDLVARTKKFGMNAAAITDHGNLYGAMEFYRTCRDKDIKPIIGYEAYVAPGARTSRGATRASEAQSHLTLLAMNRTGFDNLVKMASLAYLEGFHYKPRIDRELLKERNAGLICLSGCASSELSKLILADRMEDARTLIDWYISVFGDRFYLEIQNADFEVQRLCMKGTVELAGETGVPLVATNDAHYLTRDDSVVQDILLCVNTRSARSDSNRMKMESDQLYVRSPDEMYAAFPTQRDAVARSQEIADRVDIQLEQRKLYPVFRPPEGKTDVEYLAELCETKLSDRYGDEVTSVHRERLEYELEIISQKNFASYFLIVWDFVRFAKENGIPCGARGSACGSLVSYLLGVSDVCPLKHDLLFERFLDPSRNEPPDIDIDFCRDRRQLVIDYTKQKYGERNVAQIGTFGTLKAKAAIRDVGRALSIPLPRVDELCRMVPNTLNIGLKDALKESVDLKQAWDSDPQTKELLDLAIELEGLARSAGTHAAGVVVANVPLDTVIPLQTITGKADAVTQWDGPTVEGIGLLKVDFLGLRNLTILDKAVRNVQKTHADFDLEAACRQLDDPETFALLQRGETRGIFQFESAGIRDLLTRMKPDCFADIIATSALYRPGPLEGGMVMEYVEVKHGRSKPRRVHPLVDSVLAETHGVMVYQEQVMRILNRVGNIDLSGAYRCIKAISKKDHRTIAAFRDEYIEGARQNGVDKRKAVELFELIGKFAGYGFNKSHSTAYGLIAYETAWLKVHYPVEFMAALLSCGMESSERISEHVEDARRMNIAVLPPDINRSEVEFAPLGDKIHFGLGAIKGIGENALGCVVAERNKNGKFTDIFDLAERTGPTGLNRAALETLIRAGALDNLGPGRAQHTLVAERAIASAAARHRDRERGQKSLFGDDAGDDGDQHSGVTLPEAADWTHSQNLTAEKEVLGFYLSSHPLAEYGDQIRQHTSHSIREVHDLPEDTEVTLAGMISSIHKTTMKNANKRGNKQFARVEFEDETGSTHCILWADEFAKYAEQIVPEAVCVFQGRVDRKGRKPSVVVGRVLEPGDAEREFTTQVAIKFQRGLHSPLEMRRVRDVIARHPGQTEVVLVIDSFRDESDLPESSSSDSVPGHAASLTATATTTAVQPRQRFRYIVTTAGECRVSCTPDLRRDLAEVIGPDHVQLTSAVKRSRSGRSPSP